MKLKTSYRFPLVFLSLLLVITLSLVLLKSSSESGAKYPKSPTTEQKTRLDLIQITLSQKAYSKLRKKRNKALVAGVLEAKDSDYVPATITFNEADYKAQIRLKGDWTTHLEGQKWSFRVKLKGDKTILGMRKFSLHHPSTRRYLNEWLFHKSMKAEGLMGLRYEFVEGKIHIKTGADTYINKDVGIYAIEKTFDKRTMESNQRKEGVILKYSEDYWWNEVKQATAISNRFGDRYTDYMNNRLVRNAKPPITVFSESKVLEDSVLRNYFTLGKNLLEDLGQNKIQISDAFDIKKLAMDNALTNLFGALHGTYYINVRYYYNPITSKLEPISFDGNSGLKLKTYINVVFKRGESDTLFYRELVTALIKVTNPSYVDELIKNHKKEIQYYNRILKDEFKGQLFHEDNLRFNQNVMRKELLRLKEIYGVNISEIPDPSIIENVPADLTKGNE